MGEGTPYHWPDLLNAVIRGEFVDWWPDGPGARSMGLAWGLTSWAPGVARGEWKVEPKHHHSMGAVFGGYIAAMADLATSWGMFTALDDGQIFITSDLRISFFRPSVDGKLEWESRVVHRGRRNCFVEAKFSDAGGKLVAGASATEVIIPMPDMTALASDG